MDGYPEHLAPEFNEGGGVETPFAEWWPNVRAAFPNVPDDVAEQWLHRHWGNSPFRWLRSSDYFFELGTIPFEGIVKVHSRLFATLEEALASGAYRLTRKFWLREYMVEHRTFPVPIVVIDNTDQHLLNCDDLDPHLRDKDWILAEGHTRHELALGLLQKRMTVEELSVWWMRRAIQ